MAAYYNDNDPYCCEWVRNLIKAGLVPDGEVDERSIIDVTPEDLRGFTQCHFFSGILGWAYALRLAGWPDDRPVWTASLPCQPFSVAGKGLGTDDPRHLWPHMRDLIRECRPPVVFGEQVASAAVVGKAGGCPQAETGPVWLDGICADLEAAGYSTGACVLPAAGVSAPHIRQRLWWVADATSGRAGQDQRGLRAGLGRTGGGEAAARGLADAELRGHEDGRGCGGGPCGDAGDADLRPAAQELCDARGLADAGHPGAPCTGRGDEHGGALDATGGTRAEGEWLADAEDAHGRGGERGAQAGTGQDEQRGRGPAGSDPGGGVGYSDAAGQREREWPVADEPQQPPAERGGAGGHWGTSWLPCSDGTARRAQPGVPPLAHGLPRSVADLRAGMGRMDCCSSAANEPLRDARRFRKGTLKGAGNAIVPQVAAVFILAYMDIKGDD